MPSYRSKMSHSNNQTSTYACQQPAMHAGYLLHCNTPGLIFAAYLIIVDYSFGLPAAIYPQNELHDRLSGCNNSSRVFNDAHENLQLRRNNITRKGMGKDREPPPKKLAHRLCCMQPDVSKHMFDPPKQQTKFSAPPLEIAMWEEC